MKKLLLALAACASLGGLAACSEGAEGDGAAPTDAGEVNVYTARHYDTDLALYEDFTKTTGIKVNRIEADADALIERIAAEGEFSPADVFVTVDAGRLARAEEAGILAEVDSPVLQERIPAHLRDPKNRWFALTTRARIIIYNKAKGQPAGLATYEDLAKPEFKGRICMRSSSSVYNIALLSSIIAHDGAAKAESWAKGLVANFARPPQGNDMSNIEAVAAGECDISLVNTYYLARFASGEKRKVLDGVGIIFPNQATTGAHVNMSGAGVVKSSPNRANAVKFLEYLASDTAQQLLAGGNNEYPTAKGVAATSAVEALGSFKADTLSAAEIGKGQPQAVTIFNRAGWN
ncbi:MAG: Fe(3+) ABC transporter substrate-binding protein [Erythrobacter sp.]|jgi:iron(III) transport system substrate-binding protein|uniref:Fe(3+) ABC transporter substrate-binding protein n=1 Tax=Erythrobacter sp. TaxID=1042 RepID=UPI002B48159C|nr:Fe(3+) ABC transporter substrate-binding protein [Erythrobacter sp.]WRH71711.1 MAG: Fe(3+) ABC transporter substrate-binding protein [Erythrobacter sp.]